MDTRHYPHRRNPTPTLSPSAWRHGMAVSGHTVSTVQPSRRSPSPPPPDDLVVAASPAADYLTTPPSTTTTPDDAPLGSRAKTPVGILTRHVRPVVKIVAQRTGLADDLALQQSHSSTSWWRTVRVTSDGSCGFHVLVWAWNQVCVARGRPDDQLETSDDARTHVLPWAYEYHSDLAGWRDILAEYRRSVDVGSSDPMATASARSLYDRVESGDDLIHRVMASPAHFATLADVDALGRFWNIMPIVVNKKFGARDVPTYISNVLFFPTSADPMWWLRHNQEDGGNPWCVLVLYRIDMVHFETIARVTSMSTGGGDTTTTTRLESAVRWLDLPERLRVEYVDAFGDGGASGGGGGGTRPPSDVERLHGALDEDESSPQKTTPVAASSWMSWRDRHPL